MIWYDNYPFKHNYIMLDIVYTYIVKWNCKLDTVKN